VSSTRRGVEIVYCVTATVTPIADRPTATQIRETRPAERKRVRTRQTCPHCGEDIEQLPYCGNCGRRLGEEADLDVAGVDAVGGAAGVAGPAEGPPTGAARVLGRRGLRLIGRRPTVSTIRLTVVAVAALCALVALLADEAGWALVAGAVVGPVLTVDALLRRDVFERLAPLVLLAVAAAGLAAGAIVGGLGAWIADGLWLEDHPLDVASLGLGARAADGDGSPPLAVLALNGLLIPAVGAGLSLALPLSLRRRAAYRNEVMDGIILGAAAGGGYAIGFAVAMLWPLITGDPLGGDVPTWTVAAIGVTTTRPLILVGTTALIGAAIWRYDLTGRSPDLLGPLAAGLGWAMAFAFVSLFSGDWSPTLGLVWSLGVLIAVGAIARSIVGTAIATDRRWLATGNVVCPRCRSVTPAGAYCSICRAPLSGAAVDVAAAGPRGEPPPSAGRGLGGEDAAAGEVAPEVEAAST
jgi:hypothetical protein